jgi:UDP-N-acetylmuramyl tripeptide synthase
VATIELQDSRRLTGPSLVADGPGAVIDGRLEGVGAQAFLDRWRARARDVLAAVGWDGHTTAERVHPGGITVFHSGPVDALYAATEVNEWAWASAAADVGGGDPAESLSEAGIRLRALIDEESNPRLIALQAAAAEHSVTFLSDDDHASVGTGTGSQTWSVDHLPDPEDVPWHDVRDVPRVLVTGTNGKTTTVRMADAIARHGGRKTGFTCTDGIHVDGELVDGGDWSGPGGSRAVLRDRRVELAVLETARGGILRRGLAVDRAEAALVTNVAADHLGEWGVHTIGDVASAKLTVAKSVRHGGALVVNADDPVLAGAAKKLARPLTWIAVDQAETVRRSSGADEVAWVAREGWIVRLEGGAVYNVSNALGAAALAHAIGLTDADIAAGLTAFDTSPDRSPGRTNLFELGGVRVLVDFVHNPHGLAAVGRLVEGMAPHRLGLMVGHAGDRDDEALVELARAAWALAPRRVAVKEQKEHLRGREPGEVPKIIRGELARLGAPEDAVSIHADEVDAARALLGWARPGDMLLLSTLAQRGAVLELVGRVKAAGWRPGEPLPVE